MPAEAVWFQQAANATANTTCRAGLLNGFRGNRSRANSNSRAGSEPVQAEEETVMVRVKSSSVRNVTPEEGHCWKPGVTMDRPVSEWRARRHGMNQGIWARGVEHGQPIWRFQWRTLKSRVHIAKQAWRALRSAFLG